MNSFLSQTPEGGTGSLETSDLNNLDQPVTLKAQWSSLFAVNMGKQVYMTTPIGIDFENSHQLREYITDPERLYPIVVGAKSLRWEYKITLPSGYKIKQLPDSIDFSNSAGQYSSHYEIEQGTILVKRLLSINSTVYSAEAYPAVQALLYKPINDVRQVMVLEKGR